MRSANRNLLGHAAAFAVAALLVGAAPSVSLAEVSQPDDVRELLLLATALEHGEGVAKDEKLAFELYCRAARDGNAEAQYSLGWMYANARGVARDESMAAYFLELAAGQGHEHAKRIRHHFGPSATDPPECMKPPVREVVAADEVPHEPSGQMPAAPKPIADLVFRLAPEYNVHPRLVLAVIEAESNFDPNARSAKNAQGLMQLIPETARRFNVRKPFDPEQNIRGGLAYLRWLLAYFRGQVPLVLAGYNAGEGAVDRYRGIPPFAETREYVRRIMSVYRSETHPFESRASDRISLIRFVR